MLSARKEQPVSHDSRKGAWNLSAKPRFVQAGCVLGPLIGGQILARTGSFRLPFVAAAALAAVDLVMLQLNFEETMVESKPFDWAAVSPLRFLKLFSGTTAAFKKTLLLGGP